METRENNYVKVAGVIKEKPVFSHEMYGEKFYGAHIETVRTSGTVDVIPLTISEYLIADGNITGTPIQVNGEFRSYNKKVDDTGKNKLVLSLFVHDITDAMQDGINCIEMRGYICKPSNYRKTPGGREIADILLAVNRSYGKADYIPCVCWGRDAKRAKSFEIGTRIKVSGRIQSREYIKRFEDGTEETRTAYEVSIAKMEVLTDEE